jgi:hypothetical protein
MTLRMNKKILLPLSFIALSSASVIASQQTFQAAVSGWNEPTFSETTALNFGKIKIANGSSCTMDSAGAVTGDCDATDANIAKGVIVVSGLAPSTAMNITVTGSSNTDLSFAAATTASDGTSTVTTSDGVTKTFTTDASATDITVDVYGSMSVVATGGLTAAQAYTVDYTVDVSFQ